MKKIDKILTHFGDALCRKYIYLYFIARGVQLDNRVNPRVREGGHLNQAQYSIILGVLLGLLGLTMGTLRITLMSTSKYRI